MQSHFKFSRKQRGGIFLLLLLIFVMQAVYYFVDIPSKDIIVNQKELQIFQQEIESLRLVEIANRKPIIYPFNPNYITDYKGYTLGMTNDEIDRLLQFRKSNKWVNSSKDL
jgi:hypothetical protein